MREAPFLVQLGQVVDAIEEGDQRRVVVDLTGADYDCLEEDAGIAEGASRNRIVDGGFHCADGGISDSEIDISDVVVDVGDMVVDIPGYG